MKITNPYLTQVMQHKNWRFWGTINNVLIIVVMGVLFVPYAFVSSFFKLSNWLDFPLWLVAFISPFWIAPFLTTKLFGFFDKRRQT